MDQALTVAEQIGFAVCSIITAGYLTAFAACFVIRR